MMMDHVADQCRVMGLQVGDTIEGTISGFEWWNTVRLTLLWIGKTQAMWSVTYRGSDREEWSEPREDANWVLNLRGWRKITTD